MAIAMKLDPDGRPVGLIHEENTNLDFNWSEKMGEQKLNHNVDLFKKLGNIFGELGWISKGNTMGSSSFSYEYTSEAQFIAEVRPLFVKYRVMMLPVSSQPVQVHIYDKGQGKVSYMTTVNMEYQLVDCDTGQSITIAMPGQGVDPGDKGIYKALTGALKYVLREAFLIGTGDDPERYNDEGQVVSKENGKAESAIERGKRTIKDMVDSATAKNAIISFLDKNGIDYRNIPDDLDVLRLLHTFLTRVGKEREIPVDAMTTFATALQELGK